MALNVGATFAGYRIIRLLGSGGMGEVYLAEHPRLPRRDAVKILSPDVSADPAFRDRFHREADLAATLFHPHVVGVHDRGEYDGQLWISFDFVDGPDAAGLMRRRYPAGMPPKEAVAVLSAVASALDYAHGRGLLHRDVKPANILLTEGSEADRRILLADFGIARLLNEISGLTATNMALGTLNYSAPEQLSDAPIDHRADQYSLAATAFHLLTGLPPYSHSSPAVTISRHLTADPPAPGAVRPDLAVFDAPIRLAMAKDPAARFPSCRHFVDALAGVSTAEQSEPAAPTLAAVPRSLPVPAALPPPAPVRRSPLPIAVAAAALGLLAGAVVLGTTSTPGPQTPVAMQTTTVTSVSVPAVPTSTTTVQAAPRTTTVTSTATSTATATATATVTASPTTTATGASTAAALTSDGMWPVPQAVRYGDYRAAVGPGGICVWTGYDARGWEVDSGLFVRSGSAATAGITPTMTMFQTYGCTTWFRVAPLN